MFGLFKKKEERREKNEPVQGAEYKEFAAQFAPEELSVLAVTGPSGFSGGRTGDQGLWTASIGLTAWMEEDDAEIHQGEVGLVTLGDDQLLAVLRQRVPPDFIVKFRARAAWNGERLLLLSLPQPGFDPELKEILEQQKKPERLNVEGVGEFTLNRQIKWFEAEIAWLEGTIRLEFDKSTPEEMAAAQETAKALLADAAEWDNKIRACAADRLLETANDWAADGERESAPLTREQFMERMELDAVQVDSQGGFQFWFNDGEMFWGHAICVSGSLTEGPTDAQMEG